MDGEQSVPTKSDTAYGLKADEVVDAETNTGFFDLPAELRNDIYDLCLTSSLDLEFHPGVTDEWQLVVQRMESPKHGLTPQPLLVCSQIYHEAKPILYGSNRFVLHGYRADWFKILMERSLKLIRHITIKYLYEAYHNQADLRNCLLITNDFENLDKLVIDPICLFHFKKVSTAVKFFTSFFRSIRKNCAGTDRKPVAEVVEFQRPSGDTPLWLDGQKSMTEFLEEVFK